MGATRTHSREESRVLALTGMGECSVTAGSSTTKGLRVRDKGGENARARGKFQDVIQVDAQVDVARADAVRWDFGTPRFVSAFSS
eukprot:4595574-Pleurochrysis_carterae.AAC.1